MSAGVLEALPVTFLAEMARSVTFADRFPPSMPGLPKKNPEVGTC
jgi:hypothetical protein